MRTKCSVQSTVTFEDYGLVLQVYRADCWAMLSDIASGKSVGVYFRDDSGHLKWEPKEIGSLTVSPPLGVWSTVATMI
jgi:hypothetical protein